VTSNLHLQTERKEPHLRNDGIKKFNFDKTPFFSVCIDLYNRELTIERVLKSICHQTFNDFELVIVDSGSTDNSFEIAQKTLRFYPHINFKLVKQEFKNNEIEGWNAPIELATGKYIAICEGDDYYQEDHLKAANAILQTEENIGLYVGGSKLVEFENSYSVSNPEEKIYELKIFNWCPAPSCIVFLRQTREGQNIIFDTNFVWAAEYSLYLKILSLGYKVVENKTNNFVNRGFRFYLKNERHIQDMLTMRYSYDLHYDVNEKILADKRIFQNALHLFVFNLVYFKFNKKLFLIIKKHLYYNLEYLRLTFQILRKSSITAIKSTLKKNDD